ncbi:MAG: hypothetical protein GY938_20110 [Ketobacter sp.]|nr:hypothetical protein [Ketobacter sp.]
MRISVRSTDPGYSANAVGTRVYLDGIRLTQCFTADDELGVVYCYELDKNGLIMIDPETGDSLKEIELCGNVEIVLPREFFIA